MSYFSFGSPDDWEGFLHYLDCLLEDDSNWCNRSLDDPTNPPKFIDCKISDLADEVVHTYIRFQLLPLWFVSHLEYFKEIYYIFAHSLIANWMCSLILGYRKHQLWYKSYKRRPIIMSQGVHFMQILKLKGGSTYMERAMITS